jgi:hypothetical protein
MRRLMFAGTSLVSLAAAGAALGQGTLRCADILDSSARLACYDRARQMPPPVTPTATPLYTPDTVSKDGVPVPPADRAFDPRAQAVAPLHLGQVTPPIRRIGAVAVESWPGSGVPMVSADMPSLRPVPGARWELSLTVANHSAQPFDARLMCFFRNGDRPVADVAVLMPGLRPGDRVATELAGPPVTVFVDNASCDIVSPR